MYDGMDHPHHRKVRTAVCCHNLFPTSSASTLKRRLGHGALKLSLAAVASCSQLTNRSFWLQLYPLLWHDPATVYKALDPDDLRGHMASLESEEATSGAS